MSTTTQILFNSPALHSLKRDQLVKLCKIHTIKASGKNVDLIERLKQHAETLPKDTPLSVASRSEDNSDVSESTLSQSDGHTEVAPLSVPDPIPGHFLRPGRPAPLNTRLSAGITSTPGASTTIRLVTRPHLPKFNQPATPQLKPFQTAFDLVTGTPIKEMNVWSHKEGSGSLTADSLVSEGHVRGSSPRDVTPPKNIPPVNNPLPDVDTSILSPPAAPFIFGSPLPQHRLSNQQFRNAAASVLEEMNKRLAGEGVTTLGIDILDPTKRANGELNFGGALDLSKRVGSGVGEKFDRIHEQEFRKMDSIATHYAAKRDSPPKKRKSSAMATADGPAKRWPGGVRASGARVISNGRRKLHIPGEFMDDRDEEDIEPVTRKRIRLDDDNELAGGSQEVKKNVTLALPVPEPDSDDDKDEGRKQKEREAIRRKLEMNKARRRSSMGRVSVGGGKPPLIPNQKTRFGFLSSAKSMMQNVWNKGVKSSKPAIVPSSKPVPKPPVVMGPPAPKQSVRSPTRVVSGDASSKTSVGRVAFARNLVEQVKTAKTSGRSPIPSFTGRPPTKNVTGSVSSSRTGSIGGVSASASQGGSSKIGSRTSSVGTKSSGLRSRVSSLGTRSSSASVSVGDAESTGAKRGVADKASGGLKKISSRLLAPTASSLARKQNLGQNSSGSGMLVRSNTTHLEHFSGKSMLPAVLEDRSAATVKALDQITNSPGLVRRQAQSVRPSPIVNGKLMTPSPSILAPAASGDDDDEMSGIVGLKRPATDLAMTTTTTTTTTTASKLPARRKPRISRSRVISRLASQRAASNTTMNSDITPSQAGGGGRMRSSLGVMKTQVIGGKGAGGRGAELAMSAKKRARQSEYARRRSRESRAMKVDG